MYRKTITKKGTINGKHTRTRTHKYIHKDVHQRMITENKIKHFGTINTSLGIGMVHKTYTHIEEAYTKTYYELKRQKPKTIKERTKMIDSVYRNIF